MPDLQPNSRHCFVCGLQNPHGLQMRFFITAPGEVTVHYTVPEYYQGYPGIVHGGIIASMLDEVVGRSYMADPDSPRFMFTARLDVHYRHPVPVAKPLRLVGRMGKDRGRSATASGVIYGPGGDVLAEAEAILVDVPQEMLAQADLEILGWKVYPLEEGTNQKDGRA
ncbi:MAG: PaaI family thioesterase [Anaerolineales bacterium]|nr:PaaI family thioesterase [Anaerolineales bacterium]